VGFFGDAGAGPGGDELPGPGVSGVPVAGFARLSELGSAGMFTSALSVNEFALLSDLGPQPLAQVLGASVYQVGWQYLPPEARWAGRDFSVQLDVVSAAWRDARRLAFDRLEEEARVVGADAVVGVQLRRGKQDWARHSVDFVVSGTAIRLPGSDLDTHRPLVLSDLSVQDYWKLISGGWEAAGLLAATSVVFVSQGRGTRWRRRTSVTSNQELHEFSDGFSGARKAVVGDLRSQARSANADGVVGVSLHYEMGRGSFALSNVGRAPTGVSVTTVAIGGDLMSVGSDKRSGLVFTVHAVGTAIRRNQRPNRPIPQTAVGLGGAL
jgi:uncharacterized protein YbjQ (UPF0145 family)